MNRPRVTSWSLRRRLVISMTASLILVCIVIATVTTLAVRSFLVDRVDDDLIAATNRAADFDQHAGGQPIGHRPAFPLGQPAGTLSARFAGGFAQAAILSGGFGQKNRMLSAADTSELRKQASADDVRTVNLPGAGRFRVLAHTGVDSSELVTGLPLGSVDSTVLRISILEGIVTLLAALAALGAVEIVVRRNLRPLDRVAATASRVAALPLGQGDVELVERISAADADGRTEIGQLGAAFNHMLENVESALAARQLSETRVRQFVADASHELRTPLSAIRGYAELSRRHTGLSAQTPPAVTYAISRIESEADRMASLVDDLLLLARLDSGRPLERAEVDLSRLVLDAVNDARVAGTDHIWTLDLPEEAATVEGDPHRLHQVVANLLANARVHTPAGTVVTARVGLADTTATIEVADDGPGIEPDLIDHVFERFARADGSRSRAAGSTGLGLSIVTAVVESHGGVATVSSAPGRTVFTVDVPRRRSASDRLIDQPSEALRRP